MDPEYVSVSRSMGPHYAKCDSRSMGPNCQCVSRSTGSRICQCVPRSMGPEYVNVCQNLWVLIMSRSMGLEYVNICQNLWFLITSMCAICKPDCAIICYNVLFLKSLC